MGNFPGPNVPGAGPELSLVTSMDPIFNFKKMSDFDNTNIDG